MILGQDNYILQGIKFETALFTKNEDAYKIPQVKSLGEKQIRYTEKYLYLEILQHTLFFVLSQNLNHNFFHLICMHSLFSTQSLNWKEQYIC